LALAAGVAAAATTIYDRGNLSDVPEDVEGTGLVSIGWGLNLALGASLVFSAISLVTALTPPEQRREF